MEAVNLARDITAETVNQRKYRLARYKRYYEENREHIAEVKRNNRLKRSYGITVEQYDAMFEEQGGVCYICCSPPTVRNRGNSISSLCIDHSHKTGKVRKLLCMTCNTMLGRLYENKELLQKLINYIEEHEDG